ncbi:glycosyltransferase [Akkermansiaceae bacterium]|nr:glycosyltransferase [Akkermansiaceae bacterium]MDB4424341.1 glycosyltransferase [Akkermansiaceae bacterium]
MKRSNEVNNVLRITPSFASHNKPGSGTNAFFHAKLSKFKSYILTEEKNLNYLEVGENCRIKTIRTLKSDLGEVGDKRFLFKLFYKFISTALFTLKSFKYVRSIKPDIVHIYSPIYIVTALFCKIVFGSKIVMSIHGTDGLRIQSVTYLRLLFSLTDLNLSLSNKFIRDIKRKDVFFLGNGYDDLIFRNKNLGKRKKYVLTVGNLRWQKNHLVMIQSFKIFSEKNRDYRLIIVGEGPKRRELEIEIKRLDLCKSVFLVGKKDQNYIARIMNISEFFYLTSVTEGSPKVVFEAMACGLPIVSTNVGDVKEHICNNSCIMVENRKDSLANGLNEMAYKKHYDRIIISSKMKEKSWSYVSEKLDKKYERLRR